MTNRAILTHYAVCTFAALAVGYYVTPWLAPFAFIVASALLTLERETRRNP